MKPMNGFIAVDRRTDEGFAINCIHGRASDARADVTKLTGYAWAVCYGLGWRVVRVEVREAATNRVTEKKPKAT